LGQLQFQDGKGHSRIPGRFRIWTIQGCGIET
jgi:hypothetical protein